MASQGSPPVHLRKTAVCEGRTGSEASLELLSPPQTCGAQEVIWSRLWPSGNKILQLSEQRRLC